MNLIPLFLAFLGIAVMGAVTVSGSFLSSSGDVLEARTQYSERDTELAGTHLELISAQYSSPTADLVFRNTGRVSLRNLDEWDVWSTFHESDGTYHPELLSYAASPPAADEWAIEGLYLDADAGMAESTQPGIFDPSEEIRLQMRVDPAAAEPQQNRATFALPIGATAEIAFTWDAMPDAPATVHDGGSLASDGTYVYGLRGNNQPDFWRYEPLINTWTSLADAPWTPQGGAALAYATDAGAGYVYALRGENRRDFVRYDVAGGSWSGMVNAPRPAGDGGSLTWDGRDTLFAVLGGNFEFWAYSVTGTSWTELTNAPEAIDQGGALQYLDGNVYAFRGDGTPTFWRYDTSTSAWSVLPDAPGNVAGGGAFTTDGTDIFALQGGGTDAFWRYSVARATWTSYPDTPLTTDWGGSLTTLNEVIYAFRGGNQTDFWAYPLPAFGP